MRPSRRLMRTAPSRSAASSTAAGWRSSSLTVKVFMSDIMSAFAGKSTDASRRSGDCASFQTSACLRPPQRMPRSFIKNFSADYADGADLERKLDLTKISRGNHGWSLVEKVYENENSRALYLCVSFFVRTSSNTSPRTQSNLHNA